MDNLTARYWRLLGRAEAGDKDAAEAWLDLTEQAFRALVESGDYQAWRDLTGGVGHGDTETPSAGSIGSRTSTAGETAGRNDTTRTCPECGHEL